MPRTKKVMDEPPVQTAPPSTVRPLAIKWTLQFFALLLLAGIVFGSVVLVSQYARDQLRDRDRFQMAFADIDCNPPAPLERSEFLDEVLYHSRAPERFSALEDGLSERLAATFTQHPWVARVDKVEIAPPRSVRVTLIYRQPAMAVAVPADLEGTASLLRAVDEQGVLLPKKTPIGNQLVIFQGASRPAGAAGKPWGDSTVMAAAQTAVLLKPQLSRLGISAMSASPEGLVLWTPGIRIIWGGLKNDEATFAVKEKRLMQMWPQLYTLPAWLPLMHELDLRSPDAAKHQIVPWHKPG